MGDCNRCNRLLEHEEVFWAEIVSFQYLNISHEYLEIYILQALGEYTGLSSFNGERGLTGNGGSLVCKQNVCWRRSGPELGQACVSASGVGAVCTSS